jgi:hypothetical protein
LKGYKDRHGRIRPYRSIQGLINKQEEVRSLMADKLVARIPEGLLRQLKGSFYKVRRTKQRDESQTIQESPGVQCFFSVQQGARSSWV